MVERQQAWYFHTSTSCCEVPSYSAYFTSYPPLFLMKKWQVCVISLGMCPTTVKLFFRWTATAYMSCSLSSSQNISNCSPTQGLHMCLYTWCPHTLHFTTNWLLGVAVVLGPSAMFVFTEMSWQALIALFIGCSWQALMNPYALAQKLPGPERENYTSNNDYPDVTHMINYPRPPLMTPYCKWWKAGQGPGNEARATHLFVLYEY